MLPGSLPLTLYRGDTRRLQFNLWLDDAKTQAADLTGATAAAQIRERPGGVQITDLTCTITLPNTIDVVLSASDAHALPESGAWDLQITYPSGDVTTIIAGAVTITDDVTDSTGSPVQREPARRKVTGSAMR